MTGELTLTGKVLKVGGIKEKVIAAKRENIKTLIFPKGNQRDFEELSANIKEGFDVHFVEEYDQVFDLTFGHHYGAPMGAPHQTLEGGAPEEGAPEEGAPEGPPEETLQGAPEGGPPAEAPLNGGPQDEVNPQGGAPPEEGAPQGPPEDPSKGSPQQGAS
ncbi:LOW QUALITY PROTEIN: Lon protease homolog, mitochondrial, related [Eimeria mitis]|uniref:Lon protease homolog, mitochondrial, related n=1 Tax=Eimeria mitis TaxID=44415 RepID=U6KEF2_9EIME|nr:LOW QUALITY PROTEIN: Lon protease homolog, mitochondrial, related [Eimeria mitis]CDJ36385.1 Lon protease homolog, mitochondrial, related [Eimeria mitis]